MERGLVPDLGRAQALLLAGRVRVGAGDGARLDRKPGDLIDSAVPVELVAQARFVSRGGEKLEAALEGFGVAVTDRICLDVGASTGGFTDVLLRRGAARVYALDVGRGQLAESLRADPRVVSMERTHAARLDPSHARPITLPEPIGLAVIDVSFISLARVLTGVKAQLAPGAEIVALVKPQFEVPPAQAPKGVVRQPEHRRAAVDGVRAFAQSIGLSVEGEIESPLAGPAGNLETFLWLAAA